MLPCVYESTDSTDHTQLNAKQFGLEFQDRLAHQAAQRLRALKPNTGKWS